MVVRPSFYDEVENRPLASALAKKNISILYFNNRGAHIIKKLNVRRGKKMSESVLEWRMKKSKSV